MAVIGSFTQQPAERLDYDISYADWLEDGDTVVSATATVAPSGGLDVTALVSHPIVKLWADSGVDRVNYKVTVTTTTSAGRIKQDEIKINIRDY